jgi:hypothetical protein
VLLSGSHFAEAQEHQWAGISSPTSRKLTSISALSDSVLAICSDSGSMVRVNTKTFESSQLQLPVFSAVVSVEKIRMQSNVWKQMVLTRDGHLYRLSDNLIEVVEDTLPESVTSNNDIRKLMNFNIVNNNEIRYGILYGTSKMMKKKEVDGMIIKTIFNLKNFMDKDCLFEGGN